MLQTFQPFPERLHQAQRPVDALAGVLEPTEVPLRPCSAIKDRRLTERVTKLPVEHLAPGQVVESLRRLSPFQQDSSEPRQGISFMVRALLCFGNLQRFREGLPRRR